jgi:hypothetical protein
MRYAWRIRHWPFRKFLEAYYMKFLSTQYKKYIAAAATALAAFSIPAQATDCATICKNAASQAGNAAAQQAEKDALAYCYANYYGSAIQGCMYSKVPQIQAAYDQAYQQTLNSCTGSCR